MLWSAHLWRRDPALFLFFIVSELKAQNKRFSFYSEDNSYTSENAPEKIKKDIDKTNTSHYDVSHEGRHHMDIQLKHGLLDVCVLAAIKSEDSYGYKIIKDMKPYIELSESTLYTILKRLEAADMLTVRSAEHGGRLRKYYHITEAGLKRIEDFKDDWEEIISIYHFVTREDEKHE